MHYSETDVMTGRFVAAARVTDESGELDDRQIRDVGIFHKGPNISAATECAASVTAGEDLGGGSDTGSADRSKAVATVESQFTPPTMSSATISANTVVTNTASARYASARIRDLRDFMI